MISIPPLDTATPHGLLALSIFLVALAILVLALVTALSAAALSLQLRKIVRSLSATTDARRRDRTLEAVRRYETDPQLREAIHAIFEKSNQGTNYFLLEEPDRFHIITILNYFDGIACGIEQGLLIEPLLKDYLQFVLDKNVRALLQGQSGPTWESAPPLVDPENYSVLLALHERWQAKSNRNLYKMLC